MHQPRNGATDDELGHSECQMLLLNSNVERLLLDGDIVATKDRKAEKQQSRMPSSMTTSHAPQPKK